MTLNTAKFKGYILSTFRMLLDPVQLIVLANKWHIINCCFVLWQENVTFQITKHYFTYVI